MANRIKNEIGHRYGIWDVVEMAKDRENSNGCVRYILRCRYCGSKTVTNGNKLRFRRNSHTCRNCGAHYEIK